VFAAFATSDRPDIVYFKALYCFARDEGYPVRQQWLPTLPMPTCAPAPKTCSARPSPAWSRATRPDAQSSLLIRRLEEYLRGHTEVLLD
jgi:hypothetical protein